MLALNPSLNPHACSIEPGKGESLESVLTVGEPLILQDRHGHGFPEFERFDIVAAPVEACEIARESHIRSQLVQLAANRQIRGVRTGIRDER